MLSLLLSIHKREHIHEKIELTVEIVQVENYECTPYLEALLVSPLDFKNIAFFQLVSPSTLTDLHFLYGMPYATMSLNVMWGQHYRRRPRPQPAAATDRAG